MKSEDGRRSLPKPRAPVCSELCEDIKTEIFMNGGETSSSDISDEHTEQYQEIIVKEELEDKDFFCEETSGSICQVDQRNNTFQKQPVKEEAPKDQDFLYCEECGSSFISKCEVHGPARFIPDTPVPMGVTDRARQTVPPGLEVRESSIPNAGLGVFNVGETVPVGVHFGPYEGDVVDRNEAMNSGYSWVISKNRQCEEYIDAKQEMNANWMRYVNCARNDEEQNLVAFQYRGGIFYRCCRAIKPGQELLVWYDEEYAKDLGSAFDSLWNKKCLANGSNDALFQMFSCSLCPLSYSSQIYLHKHMKRFHSDKYQSLQKSSDVTCDTLIPTRSSDRQQTSSRTSLIPNKQMKKGIHHCSDCGRTFSDPRNLKAHQHVHTGVKPYQCSQCGKSFAREDTLEIHQRIHTGEKPYQCSQCGRSFTFQSSLRRHQRIHSGEKPYYCSQCGKSFTDSSSLRRHQRVHSGEKPYHCSQCGKRFNRRNHLEMHQDIHREEQTSSKSFLIPHKQIKNGIYHCLDCGMGFTKPGSFRRHRHVHKGQNYPCSQCGRSFTRQDTLKMHQRIHTGEKPYHCSQCGKSFALLITFQQHQRIHTGEKPYYCSQCGRSFTFPSGLRRHQRIHSGEKPYHCSHCGKSFTDLSSLRTHQRIHTGQKPYHCSQCERSFTRQDTLKMHQRIHTGEKPYHCSQCGKSFTQKSNLKTHQRIHTGEK